MKGNLQVRFLGSINLPDKWSPELAAACEVWKEIKFEFETIDKL